MVLLWLVLPCPAWFAMPGSQGLQDWALQVSLSMQEDFQTMFTDKIPGVLIILIVQLAQSSRPKAPASIAIVVFQLLVCLTTKSLFTSKGSLLLCWRSETSRYRTFLISASLQISTSVPRATGLCALRSVSTPWAATGASVTKATSGRRMAGHAPKEIKAGASAD